MQHAIVTFIGMMLFTSISFSQKKEEINFSDPFQIDSSAYFLVPRLVDSDNQDAYGKGKGFLPWGSYSEIFFYNAVTRQTKKLFNGKLVLINSFTTRRYSHEDIKEPETPPNILPNHILYLARTDNFNRDNGLDTDDPQYLYLSSKTGDHLTQITPPGMNVVSWTLSKDKKMLLVKLQNDKNGNKKFGNGDDEIYYRVDLLDNIDSIRCEPINM